MASIFWAAAVKPSSAGVELSPIPGLQAFELATEPRAIQRACAGDEAELAAFFGGRGLKLNHDLTTKIRDGRLCHVFYSPTLPGFRASPDDDPITELHGSVDPLSFIARRKPIGDSLDVVKSVLGRLPRAVRLSLSVAGGFDPSEWPASMQFHFDGLSHEITARALGTNITHPWGQDHMKAGELAGQVRILVPWRLFEGRSGDGEIFRPMLDQLRDSAYARSKLSWEGGDLQFVRKPSDPTKIVLFFGAAAAGYWGSALSREEYAWILRTEFGADESVDLSELGPHADYLVSFLPRDKIALLAEPVHENAQLVRGAAFLLHDLYGDRAPATLRRFTAYLADWDGDLLSAQSKIEQVLQALESELPLIEAHMDPETMRALDEYEARYCAQDVDSCFLDEGKLLMQQRDPELLRAASDVAADLVGEQTLAPKLLSVIRTHLPGNAPWKPREFAKVETRLGQLGFRVVRVPYVAASRYDDHWAGVSYANLLAFERRVFVPLLGLGAFEETVIARLRRALPRDYEVIGVPARAGLTYNGGIHCVFGIVRRVGASAGS